MMLVDAMQGITLARPQWLWGVLAALPTLALMWYARRARRVAMSRFGAHIDPLRRSRPLLRGVLRAGCVLITIVLVSVALAQPRWNPRGVEARTTGRDVIFLVDVSRSMLARDVTPSRLERAKLWIRDLSEANPGDRVALMAFAGAPVVRVPLTIDRSFFMMSLDDLQPGAAALGGTNIGDAIRETMRLLVGETPERPTDIVLICDGDDQESLPIDAAAAAGARGVRIIALGVGSADATIPVVDAAGRERPLEYQGQVVRTSYDTTMLQRIAHATPGGVFLDVGTGTVELDRIYAQLSPQGTQGGVLSTETLQYDEGFQYLLAAAFAALVMEGLIREHARVRARAAVA
ncbi:MAG: VWA domain-containing protein [Phycisphaerales bacterium]|jgi:Ca-activated chloride channel family protein|nr:VWA domain-containing protein [Phycisphaerales bacterium]